MADAHVNWGKCAPVLDQACQLKGGICSCLATLPEHDVELDSAKGVYELYCSNCENRWQYGRRRGDGDPDVDGEVCPNCRNDDIDIEEDAPCDD